MLSPYPLSSPIIDGSKINPISEKQLIAINNAQEALRGNWVL